MEEGAGYPLQGQDEMRPGQIPESVFEALGPTILGLPPLVRYPRKS